MYIEKKKYIKNEFCILGSVENAVEFIVSIFCTIYYSIIGIWEHFRYRIWVKLFEIIISKSR